MNSLSRSERAILMIGLAAASTLLLLGCAADSTAAARFLGSIDTLESGRVVVSNPAVGMWARGSEWTVTEEIRIGALDGAGPDVFGSVGVLEVDAGGRLYVFESQAQELRVFDVDGSHVRTIGGRGGGPGEFAQVMGMDWAPDGNLWVVDPGNSRVSVLDTAGTYLDSHLTIGGFVVFPWRGGFDDSGAFLTYGFDQSSPGEFRLTLVRHNQDMEPADTIAVPRATGRGNFFEHRSEDGSMRAGVPFSPFLTWTFVRGTQHIWFANTGNYEIFQRTLSGDTLRSISKEFDPLPVTSEDVDSAVARLEWFTSQGGRIDRSRFPSTKPALERLFVDDVGRILVIPMTPRGSERRLLDVLDPDGRYLGRMDLPFTLETSPLPIFKGGKIYGVVEDELEVPYVVRARYGRSTAP